MAATSKDYQLLEINRYPIKSLMGEQLNRSKVLATGLEYDRHWMLIDAAGRFITQRKYPQLAHCYSQLIDNQLVISNKHTDKQLALALNASDTLTEVKIWHDQLLAADYGDEVAVEVSNLIGIDCRLVVMTAKHPRAISDPLGEGEVSFADGFPYLVIGSASLDLLNSKLSEPIDMRRFRPNLVIKTHEPHEEDQWHALIINGVQFTNRKPCGRCILTTIDPDTGIKLPSREPLKTLSSYRTDNAGEIIFGINCTVSNEQGSIGNLPSIELTDKVEVVRHTS